MKDIIWIFDFDGVIVDSINMLFNVYLDFLKDLSIIGNEDEFKLLNGPNIYEIIEYLRNKYSIQINSQELLNMYNQKISYAYQFVSIDKDIEYILRELKTKNFKIALASSSKRENIEVVLNKFQLIQYFDCIVTGNDVKKSKPSPEIYNLIRKKYSNCDYYVIEDSENGLLSAIEANMKTIFYNTSGKAIFQNVNYEINSLKEIESIIKDVELNCLTISNVKSINLKIIDFNIDISKAQKKIIEDIWNNELQKKVIFITNNEIISYKYHIKSKNCIYIYCFITQYKYFFAQLKNPELNLGIKPIAVSGLFIDEKNNTLLGLRKKTTEYSDFYELIPSGSIEAQQIKNNEVLYKEQLIKEIEEETNISRINVKYIEPYCIIFDNNHSVCDICSKIYIRGKLNNLLKYKENKEYKDLKIVELKNIFEYVIKDNFVPTSNIMINNLIDKNF